MIKEKDIKDLYLVEGFLAGLSCVMADWKLDETVFCIDKTRVTLGNIIKRLEEEYENETD